MLEKHLKSINERKYSGVYTDQDISVLMNYGRVGSNRYMNRQLMHEPMFLNALRILIDHERPEYVFELGTFHGGLSAYMSDVAKNCGHTMKIISFDIDVYGNEINQSIDGVEIVQLDVLDIKHYLTSNHDIIANMSGVKLVIDDIGVNSAELLDLINPYMNEGDHFVCCHTINVATHDSLMECASGSYSVNTLACDMFGENFIENPNGFLVKK